MLKYIEETERHYRVRCRKGGKLTQKNFNFQKYGSKAKALKAAVNFRNTVHKMDLAPSLISKPEFLEWLTWFISEFDLKSPHLNQKQIFEEIKINLPDHF